MTRRDVLAALAAAAFLPGGALADPLRRLAAEAAGSEAARAAFLHDAVRERVAFGWGPRLNDESPARTLSRARGFCQTKSVLLAALMREAGIPARPVWAEIDAGILRGLLSTGGRWLDHAYVEAEVKGETLAFDSFILPRATLVGAQARLRVEGRPFGWGAHALGTATFPGWSQFAAADARGRVWGAYDTAADFLAAVPDAHNRLPFLLRLAIPAFTAGANARADVLAEEGAAILSVG